MIPYCPTCACSTCTDPAQTILAGITSIVNTITGLFNVGNMFSSSQPVNYATGTVQLSWTDLTSDGFGSEWGQTRTWTNNPGYLGSNVNGNGMVDTEMPYILQLDGNNTVAVVTNGSNAEFFTLNGGVYTPSFYQQETLVDSGGQFILTDTQGDQVRFNDFSGSVAAEQGQFVSFTDPAGNVTGVTAYTSDGQIAEVQRSTTAGGSTITESYLYSYITSGVNSGLLSNVTLRREENGGPWGIVRQVAYNYYDGSQPYGNVGDLMTATIEDANGNALDTDYYRYTAADAGSIGYVHGLKYAFDAAS